MGEKDKTDHAGGDAAKAQQHRWIFFVTGPTACGKTTVAKFIAEKLNLTFLEGDDVSDAKPLTQLLHAESI
jgi:gluconokinase